jgi:hypothetical protein
MRVRDHPWSTPAARAQARIDEALEQGSASLADGGAFIDNNHMINGSTENLHRSFMRQIEYRFISVGMTVIAYLLERVILRSIKRGGTKF